ncbi:MAG: hypothetical protein JW795_14940 [Chitinivibrionales bacterium]|nr:hypothetical protein [Chitinivibrionales bacterium]
MYAPHHENGVIRDIVRGFDTWLTLNNQLRSDADAATAAKSHKAMKAHVDAYHETLLDSDTVAVFSVFAVGVVGPDLWTCIDKEFGFFEVLSKPIPGPWYFDMGHYNLSHAFPLHVLRHPGEGAGYSQDIKPDQAGFRRFQDIACNPMLC